jgi:transcriptional regulator with XRE-family HTH domain
MSQPNELREFLRSRRARLTPRDVGLPARPGSRRVTGLRREELALVAGVSVDYYTRLEQGRAGNVSDQILDALADAMRLDTLERRHLFDLVRSPPSPTAPPPARPAYARPALRMMIDELDPTPAILLNPRLDVVAINRMGKILIDDFDAMPRGERNFVRWMFGDPKARSVYRDWDEIAGEAVAILRTSAGRDANDPLLTRLIDDLTARSPEFARHWADYRVFQHTFGTQRFHHPAVGTMTLNYESLVPLAEPDLSLTIYTAATGSPSAEKLRFLAGCEKGHPAPSA